LLNTMGMDEAVVFVDAVHPIHQVHAAGWTKYQSTRKRDAV